MANDRRLRTAWIMGAAAGIAGGVACSASMILAAVGVIGVAGASSASSTSGMTGMDSSRAQGTGGISGFLLDRGPAILIVSVLLFAVAVGIRRPVAAVAAFVVGAVMYWGMYVQANTTVMYGAIATGLAVWLVLSVVVFVRLPSHSPRWANV